LGPHGEVSREVFERRPEGDACRMNSVLRFFIGAHAVIAEHDRCDRFGWSARCGCGLSELAVFDFEGHARAVDGDLDDEARRLAGDEVIAILNGANERDAALHPALGKWTDGGKWLAWENAAPGAGGGLAELRISRVRTAVGRRAPAVLGAARLGRYRAN